MTKREGRTFWTDHQGDLIADEWWDDEHVMVAKSGRMYVPVYLPTEPADIDRMLSDLADAMGREWEGLRAKPRPFRVGDVVHWRSNKMEVRGVDGEDLWIRSSYGVYRSAVAENCTLITPAEEVEQGASA